MVINWSTFSVHYKGSGFFDGIALLRSTHRYMTSSIASWSRLWTKPTQARNPMVLSFACCAKIVLVFCGLSNAYRWGEISTPFGLCWWGVPTWANRCAIFRRNLWWHPSSLCFMTAHKLPIPQAITGFFVECSLLDPNCSSKTRPVLKLPELKNSKNLETIELYQATTKIFF